VGARYKWAGGGVAKAGYLLGVLRGVRGGLHDHAPTARAERQLKEEDF